MNVPIFIRHIIKLPLNHVAIVQARSWCFNGTWERNSSAYTWMNRCRWLLNLFIIDRSNWTNTHCLFSEEYFFFDVYSIHFTGTTLFPSIHFSTLCLSYNLHISILFVHDFIWEQLIFIQLHLFALYFSFSALSLFSMVSDAETTEREKKLSEFKSQGHDPWWKIRGIVFIFAWFFSTVSFVLMHNNAKNERFVYCSVCVYDVRWDRRHGELT